MKLNDVPPWAYDAPVTRIPTKVVYDWDALHLLLITQGFVIIESDEMRTLSSGTEECVPVKMFNSHMRTIKKLRLRTKRIGTTRWYCTF